MGKKSKRVRNKSGNPGNGNVHGSSGGHRGGGRQPVTVQQAKAGESTEVYRNVVMAASIDDLREFYGGDFKKNFKKMLDNDAEFVTDEDIVKDEKAALAKIQYQMNHPFLVGLTEPIPKMGALGKKLEVIPVYSHGAKSWIYTRGFTGVGGKELIMYDIHRSMIHTIYQLFKSRYQGHLEGRPLEHGHTVSCGNLTLMATKPENDCEGTLLKASKLLNCNRVYGMTAYDILIVKPFALGYGSDGEQPSGMEIMKLRLGIHDENGIQPISSSANLESCAWCHETFQNKKLLMCMGCKNAFYCCPRHQKLHWRQSHKEECVKLKKSIDPEDIVSNMVDFVEEVTLAEMEQKAVATAAAAAAAEEEAKKN